MSKNIPNNTNSVNNVDNNVNNVDTNSPISKNVLGLSPEKRKTFLAEQQSNTEHLKQMEKLKKSFNDDRLVYSKEFRIKLEEIRNKYENKLCKVTDAWRKEYYKSGKPYNMEVECPDLNELELAHINLSWYNEKYKKDRGDTYWDYRLDRRWLEIYYCRDCWKRRTDYLSKLKEVLDLALRQEYTVIDNCNVYNNLEEVTLNYVICEDFYKHEVLSRKFYRDEEYKTKRTKRKNSTFDENRT